MGRSPKLKDHTSLFSESSAFLFSENTTLLIADFMTLLFSGYTSSSPNTPTGSSWPAPGLKKLLNLSSIRLLFLLFQRCEFLLPCGATFFGHRFYPYLNQKCFIIFVNPLDKFFDEKKVIDCIPKG